MTRSWDGDDLEPASMAEACEHCAAQANEPCVLGCDCPACLERLAELQAFWARWNRALGRMFRDGFPLTKAVWLFEATQGELLDFPLHPELKAQIPLALWGPVPQTLDDYYELLPDEWRDEVSGLDALVEQARWDAPLGRMLRRGWPLTKAAYLVAATTPETPEFPLDAELRARIPEDLDGEVPESVEDYNRVLLSLPDPPPDHVN